MRAVTNLKVVPPAACSPENTDYTWAAATDEQRDRAARRAGVIQPLLAEMRRVATASAAVEHFLAREKTGRTDPEMAEPSFSLGRRGKPVSRATLLGWIKVFNEKGREELLDRYKGRARTVRGWEVPGSAVAPAGHAPARKYTDRVNLGTGEVLPWTPEGIDTGWGYNVGKSAQLGPV